MSYLPPLPLPALACVLLAIYLLWIHRRSKRHHPQESRLQLPPPPRPHSDNNNENLSPKVQLLRCKLALAMKTACPIHAEVEAQRPGALDEAWDGGMRGPLFRHVVLNNKTFAMSEVDDGELAARISRQPAIDAGENIKLYVNDVHTRELERVMGMRPGQSSGMQAAAGLSPHSPGYLFLRLIVNCVILKSEEYR